MVKTVNFSNGCNKPPLGCGVTGCTSICVGDDGNKYVVKFPVDAYYYDHLRREHKAHIDLWEKFSPEYKQHLMEPVKATGFNKYPTDVLVAMHEEPGVIELKKVLSDSRVSAEKKKGLIKQLRFIIAGLWKKGYIHGDLHFGNVLVTKNNVVKLIDFGNTLPTKTPLPVNSVNVNKDLSPQTVKWFDGEWKRMLKEIHGFKKGNPNRVIFKPKLTKSRYFAEYHYNAVLPFIYGKSTTPVKKVTVAQLKGMLRNRGLPTNGLKQQLMNRIKANDARKSKKASAAAPRPKTPTPSLSPDPKGLKEQVAIWNRIIYDKKRRKLSPIRRRRRNLLQKEIQPKGKYSRGEGWVFGSGEWVTRPIKELKSIAKNKGVKIPAGVTTKDEIANVIGKEVFPSPNYTSIEEKRVSAIRGERARLKKEAKEAIVKAAARDASDRRHQRGYNRDRLVVKPHDYTKVKQEKQYTIKELRAIATKRNIKIPAAIKKRENIRNYIARAAYPSTKAKTPTPPKAMKKAASPSKRSPAKTVRKTVRKAGLPVAPSGRAREGPGAGYTEKGANGTIMRRSGRLRLRKPKAKTPTPVRMVIQEIQKRKNNLHDKRANLVRKSFNINKGRAGLPYTIKELRALATKRNIKIPAGVTKKAAIITIIQRSVFPSSKANTPTPSMKMKVSDMRIANLKAYAKSKGIKGYSKYTKKANLKNYIKSF